MVRSRLGVKISLSRRDSLIDSDTATLEERIEQSRFIARAVSMSAMAISDMVVLLVKLYSYTLQRLFTA
jgi:hypothetical protein